MSTAAQAKLVRIKSLHTIVWVMFVTLITYVLWCGITANITVYSWLAAAAVIGEGLVLLIFKGHCPITIVAKVYSASHKDNFDIYLPNWLAKYNKLIFTTIFLIGLALMLYNGFHDMPFRL